MRRPLAALPALAVLALAVVAPAQAASAAETESRSGPVVRFATFNASLNRTLDGELVADLSTPADPQAANVAEIVQRSRPDVVLINEFDYDAQGTALDLFQDNYLSVPHNGAASIDYPFHYTAPSNTGVPSGFDLNNDGTVGGPDDALGFGFFPGQFGMAVYSKYPIGDVRTFQEFLWKDMPGALLPDDLSTLEPADWFSPAELEVVRLSSKSHWDLPLTVDGQTVHLLTSHPTPPVFDGEEDRNGRRNSDEIRLWADYVDPARSGYIYDDAGQTGGLPAGARFVIEGDQNSDPRDGDSIPGAAQQLLNSPRVNATRPPDSLGAVRASRAQGGANLTHTNPDRHDTADFSDTDPGNLRVDYVLPSRGIGIIRTAVFWPTPESPLFRLTGDGSFPAPSSDHRLVWADLRF
ncbi:MAG: endonuclease/exonuclease/phosphatase family protein [Geodermatophilaceae bacterium]|nr:endonuclease/exonuclease/phosphatase family protein [Geodermatophilaceae bacterium]